MLWVTQIFVALLHLQARATLVGTSKELAPARSAGYPGDSPPLPLRAQRPRSCVHIHTPDAMSKSGSLKVKKLFKLKSPEKENHKELRRATSLKDASASIHRDDTFPTSPDFFHRGDCATLPHDAFPVSPKEKKGKGKLSLKWRKKKNKKEDEGGGDVFFHDTNQRENFNNQM